MLVQSRAIDETGYVQPTIQQLQAEEVLTQFITIIQSLHGW